jgi:hypothetical protein
VITHTGARNRLVDMPWLEEAYEIDASNWVVLSAEGWSAAAAGEATLWEALERKLTIGFYLNEPELIAVIGHPRGSDSHPQGQEEVRRIVSRISSLLLPPAVIGFWVDDDGWMVDTGEADRSSVHDPAPLAAARRTTN